jgi:hypothetical protein
MKPRPVISTWLSKQSWLVTDVLQIRWQTDSSLAGWPRLFSSKTWRGARFAATALEKT